ncbi:MAG: MFS transporter [Clostridiales bacterium]|nr:MFS transporter [Clostridiales bacterium]
MVIQGDFSLKELSFMKLKSPFRFNDLKLSLKDIYSPKNDDSKGRLISLGSSIMAAFYNVFITGIFYTGFLSMYGISITGVGIVTFIPYIASCFSIFSSSVLERFQKRKWICLAARVYFYAMYIIATTLMPQFVHDPDARLVWFIVILFLAYSVAAIFNPGVTAWFYKFYPEDTQRRTKYIVYNQIFSSIVSSCVLLFSSLITDSVAGSPMQNTIILVMRYIAFVLVLIDVAMLACAKEYPYPKAQKLNLAQVFTLPFKYRKFLYCMLLMFVWNYNSNLNNGIWNYHLLNHLGFKYTLLNAMSIAYTVILLLTQNVWKQLLYRYSWVKTFGLSVLIFIPTEFIMFIIQPGQAWLWVLASVIQNTMSVGMNFSYSNILYMNLPEENSTAHIAFNTIGCNLFAFLGMMTGTFVSSLGGDTPRVILGLNFWAVQYTTLMRALVMFCLGFVLVRFWKSFTRDEDIKMIERQKEELLKQKIRRQLMGKPSRLAFLKSRK